MGKLTMIEIAGKEYPMSYSLMAMKLISRKFGSAEKVMELIGGNDEEGRGADAIGEVLEILISQGCAYKNYFEKDVPAPPNAPIIDGKWTPLPLEAIMIGAPLAGFSYLIGKIVACITGDKEKEVESYVEGSQKKERAMQE